MQAGKTGPDALQVKHAHMAFDDLGEEEEEEDVFEEDQDEEDEDDTDALSSSPSIPDDVRSL